MKFKRIISMLLTVLMLFGTMSSLLVISPAAADAKEFDSDAVNSYYMGTNFATAEERVAAMTLYSVVGNMEIYCDAVSGEVAVRDAVSGQIILTNPAGIAGIKANEAQKQELLSQIIIRYTDNGSEKSMTSYADAVLRGQVKVSNIKNGVRVEYSLGNEQTRVLAPRLIEASRFESLILSKVTGEDKKILTAFYSKKDPNNPPIAFKDKPEIYQQALYENFPITKEMAVYVLPTESTQADLRRMETIIKTYCPEYTFEQLDYDHQLTKADVNERPPANFKLALEYTIDGGDLIVTLPANGIRYNEAEYTLSSIKILPYMGAGMNPNTGYTFLPDGSGAIFRFEDLPYDSATTVSANVYGTDYAYQTITGSYEQTVRVPVFGLVENIAVQAEDEAVVDETEASDEAAEDSAQAEGTEPVGDAEATDDVILYTASEGDTVTRGFVAIIEEGDAMTSLSTYHGGAFHPYNTVQMTVVPRPKDSYNLLTAISVGSNSTWTVVSERRYTGNYKIRYTMLTDPDVANERGIEGSYDTSWQGMAKAYRDYLIENEVISKLSNPDKDIPLYIETFGSMETVEKILSIPVDVKVALTTFDQVKEMYSELHAEGVNNINFKLTGYANGGMYAQMPYKLKWEKSVGGNDGFKELLEDAKENGYGVYPDFDFAYLNVDSSPGVTLKNHVVKAIDNRYSNKRVYSASRQNYATFYQLAMSPAYYYRFIDKFEGYYLDYNPTGISVATLGYSLNSDFDKSEPYNREDSKNFTINAFESLDKSYKNIMTEGGNAYTWKHADHILNIPLDSSRYINSSYTVPFIGYVLHGYKNFTGNAINMAGDIQYEILKCIENGAYLYFILSSDNVELLKEDEYLSRYYSIRYDIWKEDTVELYKELNSVLSGLQDKEIVGHEFLIGERIPEEDEVRTEANADSFVTADDGRIVKVTYEDGTTFILNYNYFAITVDGHTVDAYGYLLVD